MFTPYNKKSKTTINQQQLKVLKKIKTKLKQNNSMKGSTKTPLKIDSSHIFKWPDTQQNNTTKNSLFDTKNNTTTTTSGIQATQDTITNHTQTGFTFDSPTILFVNS